MDTALTQSAIWGRVVELDEGKLPEGAARELLSLKFSDADLDEIDRLSYKAHRGTLSAEETRSLDGFLSVGETLAILYAKIRIWLKKRTV